jgi:hypothetical protein
LGFGAFFAALELGVMSASTAAPDNMPGRDAGNEGCGGHGAGDGEGGPS